MDTLPIEELKKIPHLNHDALPGQILCTTMFWVDGEWQFWLPVGNQLIRMQALPAEMAYFGQSAHRVDDIFLGLLNLIAQHACLQGTVREFTGLLDDVKNIGTSIQKLDLLLANRQQVAHGMARMISTEVEYLAVQCRSIFDFLQGILRTLWQNTRLLPGMRSPRTTLPDTFSKMVVLKNELATADGIAARFELPKPIAEAYGRQVEFFASLRTLRDNIVHHGSQPPPIFVSEQGEPLIRRTQRPFDSFVSWQPDEILTNDLVPLRPAINAMIYRTLHACEDLAFSLTQTIGLPPPLCPGFNLYLKLYTARNLSDLLAEAGTRQSEIALVENSSAQPTRSDASKL